MIAGYSKIFKSLIATKSYKGTTNSEVFYNWLKNDLIPQLQEKTIQTGINNWVIVVDNAQIHKVSRIKILIESYGYTLLFLSPYSPDLNPIEHIWWMMKLYLIRIKTSTKTFYQDIESGLRSMSYLYWG